MSPLLRFGTWALITASLFVACAIARSPSKSIQPESPALRFNRPRREVVVHREPSSSTVASDETLLLQSALEHTDCTVRIPAGLYVVSQPLKIRSRTWIDADPAAVIQLADGIGRDAATFLLTNNNPSGGNHDIVIEGGVWDGNNEANPRKPEYHGLSYGGVALNFTNVRGLVLRRMTIRNPESFSIRLGEVEDFLIEAIRFDQSVPRPNQDGIHIGGLCGRGVIRDLSVASASGTHDDMVAMNADDDVDRPFNVGLKCGDIHDILVEDLEAQDAYTFVRLLSHRHTISNVLIRRVRGGFRTNAINADRWKFPAGHGELRRIGIEDLVVHKTSCKPDPCIVIQSACTEVSLRDIQCDRSGTSAHQTLVLDNGRPNILRGLTATATHVPHKSNTSDPVEHVVDGVFKSSANIIGHLAVESAETAATKQ